MNHKGTIRIETKRLILRKFQHADSDFAYKNWMSEDVVTRFLRWPSHERKETSKEVLASWISQYQKKNFYQWAIELKEIHQPIGSISVVNQDEIVEKVHLGYCIGSQWWNQGITSEALQAIISFFFQEVKVNRIESQHDPENPNSGKVMEKCGMKYEGQLRQNDWNNQGLVDACVYSLLREEWQ